MLGADVNIEPAEEHLARGHEQPVLVGDDVADVVGQTAVGKRRVLAAVEDDDLGLFVQPSQAGGGRGAASDASHNQNSSRHGYVL